MPGPCPRICVAAALLALVPAAHRAAAADPVSANPAPVELRYTVLIAGTHAGSAVTTSLSDREQRYAFEYSERGRGPATVTHVVVDTQGLPVQLETTGHDYWNNSVDESFERAGTRATWRNGSENGARTITGPVFYPSLNRPPQESELLARALLHAAGRRLDLVPDGEERIETLGSREVKTGEQAKTVRLYALSGADFAPTYVWLDEQERLFVLYSSWLTAVRAGWEGVLPEIAKAQDALVGGREKAQAGRLARHPPGPLALIHARLLDPASGTVQPGTTVVITGDRISAVGADAKIAIPAGAEVVDAHGKTLMPGLWDMHVHLTSLDGLLQLAAGVTTVRDMANDTDFLLDLRRRWDAGDALGPRVIMAGVIEGVGPHSGPTKVLVDTPEAALKAVDNYRQLGYEQIKIYSSLDPALVPPIVEHAHRLGLRVSGHIPYGLTAEQAVRDGFDEIQHVNFLFLNFLPGVDTRTPQRFTAVAQHAAELDLGSAPVKAFLALLKERGTDVDPTVNSFEPMFVGRDGELAPGLAEVADRLPPQVRRGLYGGGLPVPEGMDQRYRDSFRALLAMVRALYDNGIPIVAGTDSLAGFGLHRELELYVRAGIPNLDALRAATSVPARIMKRDKDLGAIAPGKLADLILVDGQPDQKISDVRRVVLTVKGGVVYDPAALYAEIGVKPAAP